MAKSVRQAGPGLFDAVTPVDVSNWQPEPPPSLDGIDEIELDFEATGLEWWNGAMPVGVGVRFPDGRAKYYPWGHKGGGNLDEGVMKRWFEREVRNKRITNANVAIEVQYGLNWGVDLEAQGNTVSDVQHYAALLDDHRKKFALETLCQDLIPDFIDDENAWRGIDKSRIADYHASQIAPGCCQDVQRVHTLKELMWPMLTEQDLHRVRQLEDELIYVVCEMERNAAPIDVPLLVETRTRVQRDYEKCLWDIYRATGLRVKPDSGKDMAKLFAALGIPVTNFTEAGAPSFTDDVLSRYDNETIQLARRAAKLKDLLSKFYDPYTEETVFDGHLRYALHQLRTDNGDGEGAGTISGRFSSSARKMPHRTVGKNIQQVLAVEKQVDEYGWDYPMIRQYFIPPGLFDERVRHIESLRNRLWLTADAKQIEYRLFAHYANSPKIIEAYRKNPDLSFHEEVWAMMKPFKPDLLYKPLKNMNFAKIYGAGLIKIAFMMGYITENQMGRIRGECERMLDKGEIRRYADHPELKACGVVDVDAIYKRELPEVQPLLDAASDLARERGYVRTLLGRRSRFPHKQRLHKALNGVIQGSAADIMKFKLVELHKERRYTGLTMRFTVHDEVDGDVPNEESARRVGEVLNRQSFPVPLRVPILWDVQTGESWADPDIRKLRKRAA